VDAIHNPDPPLIALLALAIATTLPVCEAVWRDAARNRDLPLRITLPAGTGPVPVVLWSPGVGADRRGGGVWARGWAAAGFAVVQMEHPGSAAAVFRADGSPEEKRARLAAAITPAQLQARVDDARFILSELVFRRDMPGCDLGRIDAARAAIAGHSMGAWAVQGLAGQRFATPNGDAPLLRDQRFRAGLAFSPTAAPGTTAFRRVGIPFLAITGTLDGTAAAAPPEQRATALATRSAVYPSLPADGGKCLLVFADATHMMFAGNRPADTPLGRHVESVSLAATTAFLTAALAPQPQPIRLGVQEKLLPGDRLACK
jgi:predicted dienelactone hydrolase